MATPGRDLPTPLTDMEVGQCKNSPSHYKSGRDIFARQCCYFLHRPPRKPACQNHSSKASKDTLQDMNCFALLECGWSSPALDDILTLCAASGVSPSRPPVTHALSSRKKKNNEEKTQTSLHFIRAICNPVLHHSDLFDFICRVDCFFDLDFVPVRGPRIVRAQAMVRPNMTNLDRTHTVGNKIYSAKMKHLQQLVPNPSGQRKGRIPVLLV